MLKINSSDIDYQQSLKKLANTMRNPALIHQIQDKLTAIPHTDFFSMCIRQSSKVSLNQCIKELYEQWCDIPEKIEGYVGKDTMLLIKEFLNK